MENRMKTPLLYNLIDGIKSLNIPTLILKEEYAKTYFSESDYDRLKKDYHKSTAYLQETEKNKK